jgi:hypothetical protein
MVMQATTRAIKVFAELSSESDPYFFAFLNAILRS